MRNDAGAWPRKSRLSVRLLVLLAAAATIAGCASARDSDIPWNQPQPWEGSPMIPGLSNP